MFALSLYGERLSFAKFLFCCMIPVTEAIERYGLPKIFNSDQGSQYTSEEFTQILLTNNVAISMESKGRALDNIFIERFWRSL